MTRPDRLATCPPEARPPRDPAPGPSAPPLAPGAVERWRPPPAAVDPWTVLRLCRYRQRDEVAPAIWETAVAMAARADLLAEPTALLRVMRVAAVGDDRVGLADGPVFSGARVASRLADCSLAVLFVLTLGPRLEDEVTARAERRELLEAFLLDIAGWAAIEAALRALRQALRARRPGPGRLGPRLAPGLADWPLDEQRALVDLFGDAGGLVRLTEHGVLVPVKSVTGLFGLGRA
jgi:hypothetical protein